MVLEELALILERSDDRLVRVNVALTTVDDGNIAKTEGDDTASEDVHNVSSGVPAIPSQIGDLIVHKRCTYMRSIFVRTPIVR